MNTAVKVPLWIRVVAYFVGLITASLGAGLVAWLLAKHHIDNIDAAFLVVILGTISLIAHTLSLTNLTLTDPATSAIDGTGSDPASDPVGADLTSGWVGPTTSPADESAGQNGPGVLSQTPVPAPDPASVEGAPATNTTPQPAPGQMPATGDPIAGPPA